MRMVRPRSLEPEASKLPGRDYTRIREIGQGSYGKAVLVQDKEGALYVMKVIDMSQMDRKQRQDAVNEAKVLASLRHPYIVSHRESFMESKTLAIVMDYAQGGDLHKRIQKEKKAGRGFTEPQVLRWFTEATLALKYMHDKHVLHRDLKSQNLFLTLQDRLRIGDFGISKVLENTVAFAKTRVGTPYYLSPEICMEQPYTYTSDIWALGCVLFELMALRVPFDAQNLRELVQKITSGPSPTMPSMYSADLRQLCLDLLDRDQDRRPSALEVLQRAMIQAEIRKMLREEQAKAGIISTATTASSSPRSGSRRPSEARSSNCDSHELQGGEECQPPVAGKVAGAPWRDVPQRASSNARLQGAGAMALDGGARLHDRHQRVAVAPTRERCS